MPSGASVIQNQSTNVTVEHSLGVSIENMEYKKKKLFEAYQMLLSFFHRRNIENYSPRRERGGERERERERARSVFRHIPHFCLWKRPRFCSSEFMRAPHLCTLTLVTCWQQQQRERNMFLPVHSNNVKEICLFYRYTLQQQQQRESNVSVSTCTHWFTSSNKNVKEMCLFLHVHTGWLAATRTWKKRVCFCL